ncbi:uncharacterized protein LOC101852108 [Aplysia californica]|uniref:Uncharacterized protein LOC101852108 n=1 Tax=Aplysia californica TaxID=6500 RepID=A0ABM0JY75_APLCA|nr:uncharacterized protein LOC101852108 [Aplysia californica]
MGNIFRTASVWLKVAIICMGLGLLLFVIGFATVAWKVDRYPGKTEVGLWQTYYCSGRGCGSYKYAVVTDFHRAVQAMECIGLIGFFLAILVLLLYLCMDSCRRRDFLQAATVFTFVGVVFSCIGYTMFGASDSDYNLGRGREVGWSMGVAIAGTVAYGVAGLMLILQLIGR